MSETNTQENKGIEPQQTEVNPVGRPTKYNAEILEKSKLYLNGQYKEDGDVIPTIEGLSLYLHITRETIYDWIKQEDKEDFSYIVKEILAKQGKTLINGGLNNSFNASITKLMLSKHGYVEKQELEHNNPDGNLKTIIINKSEKKE